MTNDWSFIWSPQFLVGTVIASLLLNIVAAYVVRAVDYVRKVLPASYRRAQREESMRIEQLTAAATSDNALYSALAAEASRLRLILLTRLFIVVVCVYTLVLIVTLPEVKPGEIVPGMLLIVVLTVVAVFHYSLGLDINKRVRRLDSALRAVQQNRSFPILD